MGQVEELNKDSFALFPLDAFSQRTASERMDPVEPGELFGPNGHLIGYDGEGNKVEWLPDDENPDETWAMILRRSDDSILSEYKELWDKVWWNRQMVYEHDKGREECTGAGKVGCEPAAKIEKKYGRERMRLDDVDWGLLQGRMSALLMGHGKRMGRVTRHLGRPGSTSHSPPTWDVPVRQRLMLFAFRM